MNSERIEFISSSPFVQLIVFKVLNSIKNKKFPREQKEVIHADLVPRFSERVVHASMGERILPPKKPTVISPIGIPRRQIIRPPQRQHFNRAPPYHQQHQFIPRTIPLPTQNTIITKPTNDYGKLMPLLNDPSVSSIECPGPGKQIRIIRVGQRQITRIVLTDKEIKEVFERVADSAHVPLSEGVFRAAVDNFSINAIVSEMIGSKFIIKKQTPYAMLETR
ncbi:MAG: hypothetical protein NUV97_00960 [archaeon]|nr:hypothetical protein [archaeon]MCR4323470.1 hypothetical protein [Nanoarchaeota archaeon]